MSDPCALFDGLTINPQDPIEEKLRFKALKECIPLNVTMELTQDCNFRCSHCYNFDRTEAAQAPEREKGISLSKWKEVIDEVRAMGAFYLCFTGGEVLVYPHLLELISYAKEKGASIRLKTNGSRLSEELARQLRELNVDDIEFSLYGGTEKTHDEFTGTKGHFKAVLEGLSFAKKHRLNPVCNLILHKGCAHEYLLMKSLVKEKDIASQVSLDLSVRHDGSRGSLDYRLDHEQLRSLFKEDPSLLPYENTTGNIQCACARSNCGIGFDGSVYPCIGAPLFAGSLKEKSFKDIWISSPVFQRIRGLKIKDYKDCESCEDRSFCQRSSGLIHLNTGKYTGSEEHTCKTAALIKSLNQKA